MQNIALEQRGLHNPTPQILNILRTQVMWQYGLKIDIA